MCGRFTVRLSPGEIGNLYDAVQPTLPLDLPPRYNGAPTQDFAACRLDAAGRRVITMLRWGLVPLWAKDVGIGSRMINARAETEGDATTFWAPVELAVTLPQNAARDGISLGQAPTDMQTDGADPRVVEQAAEWHDGFTTVPVPSQGNWATVCP